jgi:hypothetical protein
VLDERELDLGNDAMGAVALAVAPVDFQVYAIDFRARGSILPADTIEDRDDEPDGFRIIGGAGD